MERKYDVGAIVAENERRKAALRRVYDPESGRGCYGERQRYARWGRELWLTAEQVEALRPLRYWEEAQRVRASLDFEYWAWRCVRIRHKGTGRSGPLLLNAPQRRVVALLESRRQAGEPMRLIILKARQWGGSTVVQMYMAWLQICGNGRETISNSVICGHQKEAAATVRRMYEQMLAAYPPEMWPGESESGKGSKGAGKGADDGGKSDGKSSKGAVKAPRLKRVSGSDNTVAVEGRGCTITMASSENQDAVRVHDFALAHLTEVAYWSDSPRKSPDDFLRSVAGSVTERPGTLIAMESTANGVANFFHREWVRAEAGESIFDPIFVPWHEIELYRARVADPAQLLSLMDDYEWELWERHGCTLEMIAWYRRKRRTFSHHRLMQAEYPTTAAEAFITTARAVFDLDACERLRGGCRPALWRGEPDNMEQATAQGRMEVWEWPERGADYVAAVDVGGRSEGADWSVVCVLRRPDALGVLPEVVAQWRGHVDHDRLAEKAVEIARHWNEALLVFESNSLETAHAEGDDHRPFLLDEVAERRYRRVYRREGSLRVGFQTNRLTKPRAVDLLVALVRDGGYVERSQGAVDELVAYRTTSRGGYEAAPGHHDDMLMTRAIALLVDARGRREVAADADPTEWARRWRW